MNHPHVWPIRVTVNLHILGRGPAWVGEWMGRWVMVITWPPPKICRFTLLGRLEWIANNYTCTSDMTDFLVVDQTLKQQQLFSCGYNLEMHCVIVLVRNQVRCGQRTLPQSFWRGHGWLVYLITGIVCCWGLPVWMRWKRRRCAARMHPTCRQNGRRALGSGSCASLSAYLE